jgi:hypothetical protein
MNDLDQLRVELRAPDGVAPACRRRSIWLMTWST